MPDEQTQDTSAGEEGFFKDQASEKPAEEVAPELTVDQLKEKLDRSDKERALLVEKLIRHSTARTEARRELKQAKAKIQELTAQFGDLPSKEEATEAAPVATTEVPAASQPQEQDLDRLLEEKLYDKEVVKAIKGKTQYREDAEVVKAYVDKMKKGGLSTGDAEQDVSEAFLLIQKRNTGSSDIPSPSSVSTGSYAEPRNRVSKGALEMGKMLGHTEEDFKKYGDGEITIK